MIFIPILALILGFLLAYLVGLPPASGVEGKYLAVAALAGMDTVFGGIRSGLEKKFHNDVFLTGFISNVLIAFFLAWLGDNIGLDLFLVAALVFGMRIFTNLSLIRRFILTKWQDERERKRQAAAQAQAQAQQSTSSAQ